MTYEGCALHVLNTKQLDFLGLNQIHENGRGFINYGQQKLECSVTYEGCALHVQSTYARRFRPLHPILRLSLCLTVSRHVFAGPMVEQRNNVFEETQDGIEVLGPSSIRTLKALESKACWRTQRNV